MPAHQVYNGLQPSASIAINSQHLPRSMALTFQFFEPVKDLEDHVIKEAQKYSHFMQLPIGALTIE